MVAMKKLLLFAVVATMFAACSKDKTEDINVLPENVPPHDVLQVSVGDEDDSRIQLDNGKTVWTQGDRISVFYKTTGNECYRFTGNTGDTRGSIMKVSGSAGATAIDKNIVIYPYNKDYELDLMNNTVSVVIPSTQRYAKNSYGVGANVMIASSSNNSFTLRNICGWLKLQFTGNAIINAIKIKGNNNEQLAGTAIANYEDYSTFLYGNITDSGDDIGGIILPGGCAREITLDCGTGLMLSDTPTEFYIAVAPQTLSKGISITAECYGNTSKINKSTGKSITITRNHIVPVANIDIDVPVPDNYILYTSSDGKIVTYDSSAFGAKIVSSTYENGIGMIVFNGNITEIGNYAFYNRSSLTSITIPNSVTSIGNKAFYGCNSLTSVTIPDGVTSIGDSAFYGCSSLTSVYITDIAKWCAIKFNNSSSNPLSYAHNLYLDEELVTDLVIPDGVTSIGEFTFYGCNSMTSITIPNSVTSIGYYAFSGCSSLTSITIPDSVTSIGDSTFYGCRSLTNITIPDSVKSIGQEAFSGCSSLTSITIPDSVTSIGDSTFYGCRSLTNITIPDSVKSIGQEAFSYCSSLTSVTIPDSVTSIGNSAFSMCSNLTSVTIPDSVASIGSSAFYNCNSLTNVTIPESVTSIGDYAFHSCRSLTSVTIPESVTSIGSYAFQYCSNLTAFYGKYASTDNRCLVQDGKLIAFAPSGLTEYVIPDNITSIGNYVFSRCSSLTSITIPDGVTSIGESAFYGCSSLTSITIPDNVTSIGQEAFCHCSSLTSINIPDSVKSIGQNAFSDCSSLTSINIPDSVKSIGQEAFSYCFSLTSINIPDSVKSIGQEAFSYCISLTSIYCKPITPPSLGWNTFSYTSSSARIYVPTASVDAYKSATGWSDYTSMIVGYDF